MIVKLEKTLKPTHKLAKNPLTLEAASNDE